MKFKVLSPYVTNDTYYKAGDILECDPDASATCQKRIRLALENGILEHHKSNEKEKGEIECGDNYSFIDDEGRISSCSWDDDRIDNHRSSLGNVFRTEKEAKKAADWLKARQILVQDTKGFAPIYDKRVPERYYVAYDVDVQKLITVLNPCWLVNNGLYFASEKDAKASIEKHEKEWKIYLGIEEK